MNRIDNGSINYPALRFKFAALRPRRVGPEEEIRQQFKLIFRLKARTLLPVKVQLFCFAYPDRHFPFVLLRLQSSIETRVKVRASSMVPT